MSIKVATGMFALASALAVNAQQSLAQDAPDPHAVLQKVLKTYEGLTFYQDTGVVEQAIGQGADKLTITKSFSIVFKRPGRLRVEWIDTMFGGQRFRYVLTSDGTEIVTYWESLRQYKHEDNLPMGLAAATGVSGGAAYHVPALLLGEKPWGATVLAVLTNLSALPDETFEDVPCYVITGKHPAGLDVKCWIGKKDYLIRRIEQGGASLRSIAEQAEKLAGEKAPQTPESLGELADAPLFTREVHRNIDTETEIADGTFRFVPPEGSRRVDDFQVGGS